MFNTQCQLLDLSKLDQPSYDSQIKEIASRWQALEKSVQPKFFLSWHWMSVWLSTLHNAPLFLEVKNTSGKSIAMGFFLTHNQTRHKFFKFMQLHLHTTGNTKRDDITIEYNNLLCHDTDEKEVWSDVYRFLSKKMTWQELLIYGTTPHTEKKLVDIPHSIQRKKEASSAYVDLKALRDNNVETVDGYLSTLGKSTRSQIRRSIRLYAEKGELTLDHAQNYDQAMEFIDELSYYHNAKWQARGSTGSIQNQFFKEFHTELINRSLDQGVVEIIRVRVGDYKFGWLYNFVYNGTVYFYLSGFRLEDDNRYKAGLVTHALTIEHHLKNGMNVYDFMGGDNRYKLNLGQKGPDIIAIALQKKNASIGIENFLRKIKTKINIPNKQA